MKTRKICLMALLVNLGLACAGVEEGFVEESGDTFVSKQLQLRWMQEVDSADRPILSFRRKSDPPTVLDRNLVFRTQPPLAIPGGVLCARNGDLVFLHAGTGEEIWSYPVSNNDWLQISFLGDRIAVYEGGGQLIILSVEGKKLGSLEVMSDSILDSDGEHVYLLSRDGIQACSLSDMQVLWARASSKKLRFHSMITGNRKIAVGYFQHSIQTQEVALLDRRTGLTRHRFMGRGIGWSDHSFFTLQAQAKEVWEWRDVSGAFLRRHKLNSFVEGEILCYKGDLIYSVENRYFSAGVTHIGRGGESQTSKKIIRRRELQRAGHWQVPYRGDVILSQHVLLDLDSGGVTGWDVSTGERLLQIHMKDSPRRVALGGGHLFVLTRSGMLQAFEIRK